MEEKLENLTDSSLLDRMVVGFERHVSIYVVDKSRGYYYNWRHWLAKG